MKSVGAEMPEWWQKVNPKTSGSCSQTSLYVWACINVFIRQLPLQEKECTYTWKIIYWKALFQKYIFKA